MSNDDLNALAIVWAEAKQAEADAVARRRAIEDKLVAMMGIKETEEGTKNLETINYAIKVTSRLTRKVDADLVQEIAAEHGLTAHLSSLFRWKPEINMAAWKSADESITRPLLGAITTTAGRPSFFITTKE